MYSHGILVVFVYSHGILVVFVYSYGILVVFVYSHGILVVFVVLLAKCLKRLTNACKDSLCACTHDGRAHCI